MISDPELTTNFLILVLATVGILYLAYRIYHHWVWGNEAIVDPVVLKISISKDNDKTPQAAEQMFTALHGILRKYKKAKHHYSLEIAAGEYGIFFLMVVNKRYQQFLENQIYAQYPDAQIATIPDYAAGLINSQKSIAAVELVLKKKFFLPLKTFVSFDVDPLASLASAISKLEKEQEVFIQMEVRPIHNKWQNIGRRWVNARKDQSDPEGKKVTLVSGESSMISEIETKSSKIGFSMMIRIVAQAADPMTAKRILEDVEAAFKQFESGEFNSLVPRKLKKLELLKDLVFGFRRELRMSIPDKFLKRWLDERSNNIVNIEELASLYHLPSNTVQNSKIAWAKSKKLPFPMGLPGRDPGVRILGLTDYRNLHVPYGVKELDRRRHMYVLGKTGTGKSTLLKNLIMGDIYEGNGVGVIDPHGDLIDDILDLIPANRIEDVVLLDPSDIEFPIGLNILKLKEGEERDIVSDGIIEIFKKSFGDSWGPRLQYLLNNAIVTLLQVQNVSLLSVPRILDDRNYRKSIVKQLKDPLLVKFWESEYENLAKNPKLLAESLSSIQNKVGRFVTTQIMRNIVGQVRSTIDLENIMNTKKIFLVNLSQGKVGEENSKLLGGMLITRLYTNAMQRVRVPEAERTNFYLYVDEFQNFATESFIKILSEARKYGLNLTVAHQYIDQLLPEVRDAIFGNVGTMLNFVVGPRDASELEKEYTPHLTGEDMVNLEKYHYVNKISVDGSQSTPFTGIALPPSWTSQGNKTAIINLSRQKYTIAKEVIDEKINKWAVTAYDERGVLIQDTKPAQLGKQLNKSEPKSEPEKPSKPEKPDQPAQPSQSDQSPKINPAKKMTEAEMANRET